MTATNTELNEVYQEMEYERKCSRLNEPPYLDFIRYDRKKVNNKYETDN